MYYKQVAMYERFNGDHSSTLILTGLQQDN